MIAGASTPEAWRWLGRLDQLGEASVPEHRLAAGAPVMLVVGAVVALAETLLPEVSQLSKVSAR